MYKKSYKGWQKHLDFVLFDLIVLQLAYILAQLIRIKEIQYFGPKSSLYLQIAVVMGLLNLVAGIGLSGYKNILRRGYLVEFGCVIRQTLIVALLSALYMYMTKTAEVFSRGVFAWALVLYVVFSYIVRCGWKAFLRKRRRRAMVAVSLEGFLDDDLNSLGANRAEGILVRAALTVSPSSPDYISTMKAPDRPGSIVAAGLHGSEIYPSMERVGSFKELIDFIMKNWVDEVYIGFEDYDAKDTEGVPLSNFIQYCGAMGVTVHVRVRHIPGVRETSQVLENVAGHTVITASTKVVRPVLLALKRLIDILGSLVGCILTGILFIFLAPAIYISSPGPIFYSHIRVGRNGKRFKLYKFRSMYPDADRQLAELMERNKITGPMFKFDNDPRIIGSGPNGTRRGLGWFIRKMSLDEFPQFFNVLKGDMSLVGTRPPAVAEYEKYDIHHRARLTIKPGITGLWQVSGRSNITDFEKVIELDMNYIENWSILLDIKIILLTIKEIFKGEGAK